MSLYDNVQMGAAVANQFVQNNSQATSSDTPIITADTISAIGQGVTQLTNGIKAAGGVGSFFKNA